MAVAAFANETGDSALGLIGDMIRNEIIAGFTESRLADVIPFDVVDSLTSRHTQAVGNWNALAFLGPW